MNDELNMFEGKWARVYTDSIYKNITCNTLPNQRNYGIEAAVVLYSIIGSRNFTVDDTL